SDKVDGVAARLLRGTSELGVQLDSFADLLNFGVAPPVLIFASLSGAPALGFSTGTGRYVLIFSCAAWMLGAVFRLARFNVSTAKVPKCVCFGVPTTLAAGILAVTFLALLKYTPPGAALGGESFGGAKLFPFIQTPESVWRYLPLSLFAGGFLMGSNLRMANLGGLGSRWFSVFVLANLLFGFILIPTRLYPELLMWQPIAWTVTFLIWGQASPQFRTFKAPSIFPRVPLPEEEGAEDGNVFGGGGIENLTDAEEEPMETRQEH
ncbi:MAG: hypothetical protein JKY56_27645, partial [Kofleriaceae bacterium]|nr:hypothetical protein [Kofleriaceae bacterium]